MGNRESIRDIQRHLHNAKKRLLIRFGRNAFGWLGKALNHIKKYSELSSKKQVNPRELNKQVKEFKEAIHRAEGEINIIYSEVRQAHLKIEELKRRV